MDLFTVLDIRFEPGSAIPPGLYGSRLKNTRQNFLNAEGRPRTYNDLGWYIAQELVFEHTRLFFFTDKPSRWWSSFAFETEADARFYANHRQLSFLHKVKLPDGAQCHRGAYNLIGWPAPDVPYYLWLEQQAQRYWAGQDIEIPEIVAMHPLSVIDVEELEMAPSIGKT